MLFQEDLTSLFKSGKAIFQLSRRLKTQNFSISMNHGHDAHFSKLVKLQYVWSKNLPIFRSVYLVRNFKINLTNKLTTKCLLTLSHYTRPYLQCISYVYVKNKLGSQIKFWEGSISSKTVLAMKKNIKLSSQKVTTKKYLVTVHTLQLSVELQCR